MTTLVAQAQRLWNTFDQVKGQLYNQFQDIAWDEDGGLPLKALREAVYGYLSDHPDQPRVLLKAHAYRLIVTQGQISIDPEDWFPSKLNHGGLLREICQIWWAEAEAGPIQDEAAWFKQAFRIGLCKSGLDTGHISPGWENMFRGGLTALLDESRLHCQTWGAAASAEQRAFYEAIEIVYQATIAFAYRLADRAATLAETCPEHAERMRIVSQACRRVPAHSPQSFHQSLQFAFLMHELIEMEGEYVRSMGHLDRVWYPYYRTDIGAGRLTREQAKELLKFLWLKYHSRTRGKQNGKNFLFGGQDAQGHVVENELTYVALEAYEELNTPDPKLSVRFLPGISDRLYERVADLIRKGHNSFVLMNDEPAVAGLIKMGKATEDARTYLPIGCYEPAVDGKEAGCTMNLTLNLTKSVEYALHDGLDPLSGLQIGPRTGDPRRFPNFEALFEAAMTQLDFLVDRSIAYIGAHERQWPEINPSPLIAGTIADCLARGKDIGQGGPVYNSVGCVGAGLANTTDALLALKQAVFEEGVWSMRELIEAIDTDFAGQEAMRQYLIARVPKWGNDDPAADALAKEIADHYTARVHSHRNARGGRCQAALFTLDYQWVFGRQTGALPDGRHARTTLAPGVGAMSGRDRAGVTAQLNSVSKLDFSETPNGAVLDITLHPTAVQGEEGLKALVQLIKTFFAQGGYALQFNVFDVAILRKAQRNPENYASLQIRVTGWSVFFVNLTPFEQEQFIARNTQTL